MQAMSITEQTTISEIAGALPSSVRVFQRHGIDFCCGGKRPIGAVCEEQGLSFPDLAREIQSSAADPGGAERDWSREPLARLIAHIVTRYHQRLREELPVLETMAVKVARVHGAKAAHLARLETIAVELSADLHAHMQKEEIVLFPTIEAIESRTRPVMPIAAPISVMEHEHDHAGQLLAELRYITRDYEVPDWACTTFRALYRGLATVEADMHVHVHLENNILFPRALALVAAT
jgi:regulator of cell morphogenesis and NO signaling